MICSKCGKEFEGRFCPWCGAAGEESEKASAADKIAAEEAPKEEAPKEETAKAEAPKEETPKEEAPKAEEEKKIAEQAATEEKAEGSAGAGKIKCPKCGNVFSGKFCPECGYKAAELDKCPVCGAPHKAGDKFCAECGYSYEKKPNAAAATVAGIGTAIKNSCKNALAFCKKHSKKVIAAAVAVALILVIVVPISVVFTSPVQPANVDRIKIGDTQERVLSILGDPYDWKEGDTTFEYYSDNYLKIKKELDKISNMEDMESFGDFADALEKEEELNAKLETLEYKETTISFDEDGLVTKVVYNACVSESEEQAKEIKSKEVLTESIRVYEKSEVVYTIKYTDKSIVKAIAQVTPDMLLDEYAFSIYDPFAPENKIELSCKVVEDPNSNILYAITLSGVNYNLTKDGMLTISGNGKVKKGGIRNTKDIKNIIVQEGITEIEQGAFGECTKIESITVPFVGASLNETENTHFGYIFGASNYSSNRGNVPSSLKEVVITGGTSINDYAFSSCDSLTNITMPDDVISIGDYAFSSCDSITNITIPDSVTSIGDGALYNCDSLTSIVIPDSVTSIGEEAFRECRALKSITIPDSVTSIGSNAFYGVNIGYKITYVLNGGANAFGNPQDVGIYDFVDSNGVNTITLSEPSKLEGTYTMNANGTFTSYSGYEFLGWYKDNGFTEKVEEITLNTGNVTLYAKWSDTSTKATANYMRVNENNEADKNGSYILFGQYPQTIKAEGVTVGDTADKDGYYLGSDGERYAKVVADPYNSGYTFSDNSSVTSGNTYYFKVEPIRWRILSESGGKVFILCDSIIANHYYHHTTSSTTIEGEKVYANNYKHSDIRAWLNDEFYKTAFGELQQALIATTEVDNSVESTGYSSNPYACENTNDKIFLLSYSEVVNIDYGFASSPSTYNAARRMLTSDFSRATGAYMNTNSSYYGNGWWWLRSPNYYGSYNARHVGIDGNVYYYSSVYGDNYGVVPALNLMLS